MQWLQVPKLGYVATAPGSVLKFTVDTSSTTQTGVADPHTVVTLSHMKSYEGMGQAGAPLVAASHTDDWCRPAVQGCACFSNHQRRALCTRWPLHQIGMADVAGMTRLLCQHMNLNLPLAFTSEFM